ncbi:PRTRC system ParB family protein [Sphingobium sp.]|uniref:PRTRC system ParB family protein n=1 Tax=Sphingobium sp. TaxID=1912891 RepID=UPI002614EC8D|nr:PRTRC system ParB family protein [Sphingobium sp.]
MTSPQPSYPSTLPLSKIVKKYNPRRYFDPKKHAEMVASIKLRGISQPILLRPTPDGSGTFTLVAGERRYRGALEVYGPDGEVPVLIREMTDQEALEAVIDENENRDNVSETEQADAAVLHLAACQNNRAEAARRLGWTRAKLDRRLALADLSDTVKCALNERRIKVGHAELLAVIPGEKQDTALDTILRLNLDVNDTRKELMRITHSLASACFDKIECSTCPFNSAAQKVLFEIHVDDGHCTNPGCFELKTEAAEVIRFEQEEMAAKAARNATPPITDDADDNEQDDVIDAPAPSIDLQPQPGSGVISSSVVENREPPARPAGTVHATSTAHKPTATARSIAARTIELREAAWRTALARALAGNAAHARTTILVAAMSGTLSQIKPDTLTSRAGILIGASFPDLDFKDKIAEILALPDARAANVLAVIGGAYAQDVLDFARVADLARTFEVDLRGSWQVDQAFLERYTKDELKFIAQECGLIAHVGEKRFAKLLASKKTELVTGMLNRIGFDWAGRLPSAMTLDGAYGSPPDRAAPPAEAPIPQIAA